MCTRLSRGVPFSIEQTRWVKMYVNGATNGPCALRRAFCTRQNVVVPPLSHVKRPELLGVSQDLAVSQTGYIARQGSD